MGTAACVQTATTKVGEECLAGYIPLQALDVHSRLDKLWPEGLTLMLTDDHFWSSGCCIGHNACSPGDNEETHEARTAKEYISIPDKSLVSALRYLVRSEIITLRLVVESNKFQIDVYFHEKILTGGRDGNGLQCNEKGRSKLQKVMKVVLSHPHSTLEIVQGDDFGKEQTDAALEQFDQIKGLRDAIFQIINPRDWRKECDDPSGIKCSLFRYQKRALSWMLYRETNDIEYTDAESLKARSFLAPECIPMKLREKMLFFNHSQGCFTETPMKQALPAGGILADEMGLGKTVEIISLILATREQESDHRKSYSNEIKEGSYLPGGTLVVCPPALLHQWESELRNHAGHTLKVCVYQGIRSILDEKEYDSSSKRIKMDGAIENSVNRMMSGLSQSKYGAITQDMIREAHMYARRAAGEPAPTEDPSDVVLQEARKLAQADVVLTAFDVLQREIHYDSSKNSRALRNPKRYLIPDCALLKLHFYRIVADEAQMMGSLSQVAQMMEKIVGEKRWCVTGTPMVSSNETGDLLSLLSFLGMNTRVFHDSWKSLIAAPLKQRNSDIVAKKKAWIHLVKILLPVMWRTDKITVKEEFHLPPRSLHLVPLRLQAGEAELYNQLVEKARDIHAALANESAKSVENDNVSLTVKKSHMKKLIKLEEEGKSSLMQLRLACIHPQLTSFWRTEMANDLQIGSGGMTSMEEVLQRLADKEQGELQESERMVCSHLNTIAMHLLDKADQLEQKNQLGPSSPQSPGSLPLSPKSKGGIFDAKDQNVLVENAIKALEMSQRISEKGIAAMDLTSDATANLPDPEALASSSWAAWRRIQINLSEQMIRAIKIGTHANEQDFEKYQTEKNKRIADYHDAARKELEGAKKNLEDLESKLNKSRLKAREKGKEAQDCGFPDSWGKVGSLSAWLDNFDSNLAASREREEEDLSHQASTTEHILGKEVFSMLSEVEKVLRMDFVPLESFVHKGKIDTAIEELSEHLRGIEGPKFNWALEETKAIPFKNLRYAALRWAHLLTPFKRDSILSHFGSVLPVPREVENSSSGDPLILPVLVEESLGFSKPQDCSNSDIIGLAAKHQEFIPSSKWMGRVKGYSFYLDGAALGYHADDNAQVSQETPIKFTLSQCLHKMLHELSDRSRKLAKNTLQHDLEIFKSLQGKAVACRFQMTSNLIEMVRAERDLHTGRATCWLKERNLDDIEKDALDAATNYPIKNLKSISKLTVKLDSEKQKALELYHRKNFMSNRLKELNGDMHNGTEDNVAAAVPENAEEDNTSAEGSHPGANNLQGAKSLEPNEILFGPKQVVAKAPGVECPVCLVPIQSDVCLWSSCGHTFCYACSEHLFKGTKNATCPICRSVCSCRNVLRVAAHKKNGAAAMLMQRNAVDPTADDDPTVGSIIIGSEWSIKISALLRRIIALKSSAPQEKSLIFSQFPAALKVVSLALRAHEIPHVELYGKGKQANHAIQSFREDESIKAFLIAQRAGAQGLTLVRANNVFLLEPSIDPAIEQQAISRVHRIGQQRPVRIMRLMTRSTIEEQILNLQQRRQNLFAEKGNEPGGDHSDDLIDEEDTLLGNGDVDEATTVAATYAGEVLDKSELNHLFNSVLH
eukprot:jgi/Picsp_1/1859/NSC_05326-R1_snf2 histone linker phd ring